MSGTGDWGVDPDPENEDASRIYSHWDENDSYLPERSDRLRSIINAPELMVTIIRNFTSYRILYVNPVQPTVTCRHMRPWIKVWNQPEE